MEKIKKLFEEVPAKGFNHLGFFMVIMGVVYQALLIHFFPSTGLYRIASVPFGIATMMIGAVLFNETASRFKKYDQDLFILFFYY